MQSRQEREEEEELQAALLASLEDEYMPGNEKISSNNGYTKIAVISSIGTRNYYRKLGYELEGLYMTKKLEIDNSKPILNFILILFIIYLIICQFLD